MKILSVFHLTVALFFASMLSATAETGEVYGVASTAPDIMWLNWIGSVAALLFAFFMVFNTLKRDAGSKIMRDISHSIQTGATAYLAQQYKVVGIFFGFFFVLFLVLSFGLHMISVFVPFA